MCGRTGIMGLGQWAGWGHNINNMWQQPTLPYPWIILKTESGEDLHFPVIHCFETPFKNKSTNLSHFQKPLLVTRKKERKKGGGRFSYQAPCGYATKNRTCSRLLSNRQLHGHVSGTRTSSWPGERSLGVITWQNGPSETLKGHVHRLFHLNCSGKRDIMWLHQDPVCNPWKHMEVYVSIQLMILVQQFCSISITKSFISYIYFNKRNILPITYQILVQHNLKFHCSGTGQWL